MTLIQSKGQEAVTTPVKSSPEIDAVFEQVNLVTKDFPKLKEDIEKLKQSQQDSMVHLLTIFGVFASILAFLNIEFKILQNLIAPEQIVGFSLFFLGSIWSFALLLCVIAKEKNGWKELCVGNYFSWRDRSWNLFLVYQIEQNYDLPLRIRHRAIPDRASPKARV